MITKYFYHELLKKYVTYFGSIFNDIVIKRTDSDGVVIQTMQVPISYGPKHKYIARFEQDLEMKRDKAIVLPRMSFDIINLQYDGSRKLNAIKKIVNVDNNTRSDYVFTPVPYNITFELALYARNVEDNLQILEQILPFFTPEFTSQLIIIPELDIRLDIPLILASTGMMDNYQGPIEQRRTIVYTLTFIMKGYLFGPVQSRGVIKRAISHLNDSFSLNQYTRVTVQPVNNLAFSTNEFVYQLANNDPRLHTANGYIWGSNSSLLELTDVRGVFRANSLVYSANTNATAWATYVENVAEHDITITVRPAMLANGWPTTNAALSVDLSEINRDDNYGISVNIEEFLTPITQ